jgi:pectate lyase
MQTSPKQKSRQKMRKYLAGLLAIVMVFSVIATPTLANEANISSGTWFETAWVTWTGEPNATYQVYIRANSAYYWRDESPITGWLTDFTAIDNELIRFVDHARNTWRADILGLPWGSYDLQIRDASGDIIAEITDLETWAFPRYGAAFVPSHELPGPTDFAPYGATGGYLSDGRVDPNAIIMYVSHNNWSDFTPENLALDSDFRQGRPLVVRFLGTVGHFDRVHDSFVEAGAVLPSAAMADGENHGRMFPIGGQSHHITFEGVGTGSTIFGWGMATGEGTGGSATGSSNLVFRNLTFSQYFQFGLRIVGGNGVEPQYASSNVWVHNNILRYGQNLFLHRDDETDRSMARGVVDAEPMTRGYTISYNKFVEVDKTHLILGGNQNIPVGTGVDQHYGTFHHNWYLGTRERNPRVRHHNVHVFNNLFQDIQGHQFHYRLMDRQTGYAIGAGNNATIWAEGNIFDNVNFPFVRSRHGHARGYYPHQGHNHLFGDGPGFMVTGDNVDMATGNSIGAMHIPATLDEFGSWTPPTGAQEGELIPSFIGMETQDDLDNLRAVIQSLQPNVLDTATQNDFDFTRDIGIVVDDNYLLITPPDNDQLAGTMGFPALGAQPNQRGWAFDGAFRPSSLERVWSTSSPQDVANLRAHIESYAGSMQLIVNQLPIAPTISSVRINPMEYIMHSQNSPMPSLRIVTYPETFTINWISNDVTTEYYEIQTNASGEWVTMGRIDARPQVGGNHFVTQEITDLGNLVFQDANGNAAFIHISGENYVVAYPRNNHDIDVFFTDAWAIANIYSDSIDFRLRAVNAFGASDWNEYSFSYDDSSFVYDIVQIGHHQETNYVSFTFNTYNIADGTYNISLSVPRSMARDTMPWPAARNFTGDIMLLGAEATVPEDDNLVTSGNGGTGTITIEEGIGTIDVAVLRSIPVGIYDLVLTIETPNIPTRAAINFHVYHVEDVLGEADIIFELGSTDIIVGETIIEAAAAPFVDSGATMIPLRALAEALGYEVAWNAETATIQLNGISIDADELVNADGHTFVNLAFIVEVLGLGSVHQYKINIYIYL